MSPLAPHACICLPPLTRVRHARAHTQALKNAGRSDEQKLQRVFDHWTDWYHQTLNHRFFDDVMHLASLLHATACMVLRQDRHVMFFSEKIFFFRKISSPPAWFSGKTGTYTNVFFRKISSPTFFDAPGIPASRHRLHASRQDWTKLVEKAGTTSRV